MEVKRGKSASYSCSLRALLPGILILAILLSLAVGAVNISATGFGAALRQLLASNNTEWTHETVIIWQLRLPRILLAAVVGAALATAGAVMQGLLHNGMADSYVLGVSSGASLGASIAMILGLRFGFLGLGAITPAAFIGAVVTLAIVISIARRVAGKSTLDLLLAGIAMSSFLSSLVSLLVYFSGERIHPLVFWLMGGFSARNWSHFIAVMPYLTGGYVLTYIYHRYLTAISLSDSTAHHLGVNVEKVRFLLLGSSAMLTAASVSVSGGIGFVGLIIPHIGRIFVGHNYRRLLPTSALLGAIFLVLADLLARTIVRPAELPVGIITAMCGGPFFLFLLAKRRKEVS
jgi:iron complex transport system permease protein